MKRTSIAAILLAVCAAPCQIANATACPAPELDRQGTIVLKISDLRSAYLQRAGVVRYDRSNLSPDGIRQQLQRHFNVVLGLLLVSTPQSIETALARLEAAEGQKWSEGERTENRRQLLAMRYMQLQRLAAYRDRGLFPQNEEYAKHAVPIFVDRHDTACAVGQLMRWSGWSEEVASIERSNNLIYVPDALNSAVSTWVLTSGLTVEEAALIQPAYAFVTPYLTSNYESGELSFVNNGLKYENFHIEAQNFTKGPLFSFLGFHRSVDAFEQDGCNEDVICALSPQSGGFLPNANAVGFQAGAGVLYGDGGIDVFHPLGTNWIVMGGYLPNGVPVDRSLLGRAQNGSIQRIIVSFDVSTTVANTFIDQIAENSYPTYGGFNANFFGAGTRQYEFTTAASHSGSSLGSAYIEDGNPHQADWYFPQTVSANLSSPTNTMSVSTTIWLYDGATIDSYVLGFRVIPEPTSLLMTVSALVLSCTVLRQRRFTQPR